MKHGIYLFFCAVLLCFNQHCFSDTGLYFGLMGTQTTQKIEVYNYDLLSGRSMSLGGKVGFQPIRYFAIEAAYIESGKVERFDDPGGLYQHWFYTTDIALVGFLPTIIDKLDITARVGSSDWKSDFRIYNFKIDDGTIYGSSQDIKIIDTGRSPFYTIGLMLNAHERIHMFIDMRFQKVKPAKNVEISQNTTMFGLSFHF